MFPIPDSSYAQWRLHSGNALLFREENGVPPEYLLQAVWQHQRLRRDELRAADGRRVRVLHPGFLSREGGPDFKSAVIQFDDDPPQSGDVEVDLLPGGWRAHAHDRNPAFARVILHVVWNGQNAPAGSPPMLALSTRLDASVEELAFWIHSESSTTLPDGLRGQCCTPLRELTENQVSTLLKEAGEIRFQAKAAQLQARARQAGWEQALWEGLFRALGYKHNAWPMQCLAEQRPVWMNSGSSAPTSLQARLLGISGLLPADLTRAQKSADGYLRAVWDHWWRERNEFDQCLLPRSLWRFHGQRPANHPQRRLALAAHWLASNQLPAKIERWCSATIPDGHWVSTLLEALKVEQDAFWSWHWTIRSPRLGKPQPLLGGTRVTDLAVNVILPWLWVRARDGKNEAIQSEIWRRYTLWPAAEDNSVLRLGRVRLLGPSRRMLRSAIEQQGLIQITRDFCDHSNSLCENCRFPELVRKQGILCE